MAAMAYAGETTNKNRDLEVSEAKHYKGYDYGGCGNGGYGYPAYCYQLLPELLRQGGNTGGNTIFITLCIKQFRISNLLTNTAYTISGYSKGYGHRLSRRIWLLGISGIKRFIIFNRFLPTRNAHIAQSTAKLIYNVCPSPLTTIIYS